MEVLQLPGVAIFADIIKIITRFINQIFKDSRKAIRIRNYVLKRNLFAFYDRTKFSDFRWKIADVSRSQGVCHMIHIFFGSFLGKV